MVCRFAVIDCDNMAAIAKGAATHGAGPHHIRTSSQQDVGLARRGDALRVRFPYQFVSVLLNVFLSVQG
jgi:hypothetical protein